MPVSAFIPLIIYCFVSSITPGPANITSLSAAIQYGYKAALRQWTGLITGFLIDSIIIAFVSFFLGEILDQYIFVFSYIGAAYLVYLALKMLRRSYTKNQREVKEPGFFSGLLVQLTNVKVQIYCLTVMTTFILPYYDGFLPLLIAGLLLPFMPFSAPASNLIWIFAGAALQRFFVNHQKAVNVVMALSLLYCAAKLAIK